MKYNNEFENMHVKYTQIRQEREKKNLFLFLGMIVVIQVFFTLGLIPAASFIKQNYPDFISITKILCISVIWILCGLGIHVLWRKRDVFNPPS